MTFTITWEQWDFVILFILCNEIVASLTHMACVTVIAELPVLQLIIEHFFTVTTHMCSKTVRKYNEIV